MELKTLISLLPRLSFGVLVCGIVVADDMDLLLAWERLLHLLEKAYPFLMPVLLHAGANDFSCGDVERRKQGGGSVALVVVGHRRVAALFDGQPRLGAIQRLNLTCFIAGKHHRMFRRVQIEAHDVFQLLDKVLVVGEFEGAA